MTGTGLSLGNHTSFFFDRNLKTSPQRQHCPSRDTSHGRTLRHRDTPRGSGPLAGSSESGTQFDGAHPRILSRGLRDHVWNVPLPAAVDATLVHPRGIDSGRPDAPARGAALAAPMARATRDPGLLGVRVGPVSSAGFGCLLRCRPTSEGKEVQELRKPAVSCRRSPGFRVVCVWFRPTRCAYPHLSSGERSSSSWREARETDRGVSGRSETTLHCSPGSPTRR